MTRHQLGIIASTAMASLALVAVGASAGSAASTKLTKLKTVQTAPLAAPQVAFKIDSRMKSKLNSMQWTLAAGKVGRPILSGNRYRLVNDVMEAGIKRQKRISDAADLGWLPKTSHAFNVMIRRQAGDGQVRYGDVVALEVQSYGWLRYKKRRSGINLTSDNHTPHYMWIVTGGKRGTKLVSGMPFALYNGTERTEMTYCQRGWGIDLGWQGKSRCGSKFGKVSNFITGPNGLLARDGLSGAMLVRVRDHICETAVGALVAEATANTGGAAGPLLVVAGKKAIDECKKI